MSEEIFTFGREGGREEFLKNGYPLLSKRVENVLLNWRSSSFPKIVNFRTLENV